MGFFKHMEGMPTFVNKGGDVCVQPHRILENKRQPDHIIVVAVRTRCFSFSVLKIEQALHTHDLKILSQLWVNLVKNRRYFFLQLCDGLVRLKRFPAYWVNI